MSVRTFLLPDLGEGLTEAELVSWLVSVGDTVVVDQPVAEVETAKSLVEVPSPFAGRVAQLHGAAGQSVDVGRPLISVDTAATAAEAPAAGLETAAAVGTADAAVSAAGEAYRQEEKAGSGNVLIGYGTPETGSAARRSRMSKRRVRSGPGGPAVPVVAPSTEPARLPVPAAGLSADGLPGEAPRCISPLVRRLARDAGLKLADVTGTGSDGLILRRDVHAALQARSHAAHMPHPVSPPVPAPGRPGPASDVPVTPPGRPAPVAPPVPAPGRPGPASDLPVTPPGQQSMAPGNPVPAPGHPETRDTRTGLDVTSRTPVRGLRRTAAATLGRSRREIPEATVWVDADATALMELRADLAGNGQPVPSLLAFLARFTLAGLARFPELNTRFVPAGVPGDAPANSSTEGEAFIEAFSGINLGIAVQTPRGLMVPAVRRADALSTRQLDAEIGRLTTAAKDGKATAADLTSGTFTLNNYGVFGVDGSAAIINYPESAILGVGRIIDKPWVAGGELAVRKMTELTLVFDHRVCDGGTAGGFLRYVADAVENPARVLADL